MHRDKSLFIPGGITALVALGLLCWLLLRIGIEIDDIDIIYWHWHWLMLMQLLLFVVVVAAAAFARTQRNNSRQVFDSNHTTRKGSNIMVPPSLRESTSAWTVKNARVVHYKERIYRNIYSSAKGN
jgi:hypothetical protein